MSREREPCRASANPIGPMALLLAVVVFAGACTTTGPTEGSEGVLVVATTTILGDLVENLVGDAGRVEVLVPVGADPHDFQASAQQAALVVQADLVVANGLGLEESLADVLTSAEADGAEILEVAPLLSPIPFAAGAHQPEEDSEMSETGDVSDEDLDPHVWLDPVRMAEAVRIIARRLADVDENLAPEQWEQRAEAYAAEILAAHNEIAAILDVVEPQQRKLVTNHDALGYFALRYDFEIVGVVIPGGSTLAEPSVAQLTELVTVIEKEGVRAIVVETTQPAALAEAIAREVGHTVRVVSFYTGSLGEPGSGAETYLDMIKANARRIAAALG